MTETTSTAVVSQDSTAGSPDLPTYYQSNMIQCIFLGRTYFLAKEGNDLFLHIPELRTMLGIMFEGRPAAAWIGKTVALKKLASSLSKLKNCNYYRDEGHRKLNFLVANTQFISLRVALKFLETELDLWGLDPKPSTRTDGLKDADFVRILLRLLRMQLPETLVQSRPQGIVPKGADGAESVSGVAGGAGSTGEANPEPTKGKVSASGPSVAKTRVAIITTPFLQVDLIPVSKSTRGVAGSGKSSSSSSQHSQGQTGTSESTAEDKLSPIFMHHKDAFIEMMIEAIRTELLAARNVYGAKYQTHEQLNKSEDVKEGFNCLAACKQRDAAVAPTTFKILVRLLLGVSESQTLLCKKNDKELLPSVYAGKPIRPDMFKVSRNDEKVKQKIAEKLDTAQLLASLLIQIMLNSQAKCMAHIPWPYLITSMMKKCGLPPEGLAVLADLRLGTSHDIGEHFDRTGPSASHFKRTVAGILARPDPVKLDKRFTKSPAPPSGTWKRKPRKCDIERQKQRESQGGAAAGGGEAVLTMPNQQPAFTATGKEKTTGRKRKDQTQTGVATGSSTTRPSTTARGGSAGVATAAPVAAVAGSSSSSSSGVRKRSRQDQATGWPGAVGSDGGSALAPAVFLGGDGSLGAGMSEDEASFFPF